MKLATLVASVLVGAVAAKLTPAGRGKLRPPAHVSERGSKSSGHTTFEQLIDHDNPELGTFSQRYWWSDEYWTGPGAPVVFFTPGEVAADGYSGYLTTETLTGLFAEAIGGAVVMMEHRYWGESSPYDELTTENLQYLTLANSIADCTYLANNVDLPFDTNGSSNAANAPWVLSGGSYSGALSAWVASVDPGTFWAYHASSAVVETIYDFWTYFAPIQAGMASNCSSDVSLVVDYVDGILLNGTDSEKSALKTKFGLDGLEDADFAAALENGPWLWQDNEFYTGYSDFFVFCDYVENVYANTTTTPTAAGVGLEKALAGYAQWTNEILIPGYCASYGYWTSETSLACFDTYNASSPIYTDMSVSNVIDRQWNWFLCNEPFAYWQDGAPANTSSVVSRLVSAEYWQRQCDLFFPPEGNYTYGSATGKTVADVNAYTGGWDMNTTRLIWTNGEFDPWRDSTVSSDYRPGGPLASTAEAPVQVIPGGVHCFDLLAENGEVNEGTQTVIDNEIAQIVAWVDEWPGTAEKRSMRAFAA